MGSHLLYYAIGLVLGIAIGAAVGSALEKEQRRKGLLLTTLAISVPFGLFVGYAIDTFATFAGASATMR